MLNQCTLTTDTEVVICPSQVHLQSVKSGLRTDVAVGAQDVWHQGNGAFTGETSAEMLTDIWALNGSLSVTRNVEEREKVMLR
mmetsp:Transcript_42488/g.84468  ORF Transcript_42488/g.84468 Transcript_42488/m.84468 type:complete len:83 (-) Transcript_42488:171-419(-)